MCVFNHGGLQDGLVDKAIGLATLLAMKIVPSPSSIRDFQEFLVYFLIGQVMQTVLTAMPGLYQYKG